LGRPVGQELRKEIHAVALAGLIHGRKLVPVMHPYSAVSQGMDLPLVHTAMLVLLGHRSPALGTTIPTSR
jgi:hypothetical protein